MSRLPARTGWLWLKEGFALFRKQPGILMALMFTYVLALLVLMWIPLLGQIAPFILIPSATIAIMQACRRISEGERVTADVLLTGLRQPVVGRLCRIGLIYLAELAIMLLLALLIMDAGFLEKLRGHSAAAAAAAPPAQLTGGEALRVLAIALLHSFATLCLNFAAPLAYWKGMAPLKAAFYSVFGALGAIRPLLLTQLIAMGWLLLAVSLISAFLGQSLFGAVAMLWTILLYHLLLQCAAYAAYRQIFGAPDALSLDKPDAS